MLDKIQALSHRLLSKCRFPLSSWLFKKKIAFIDGINKRLNKISFSRGVFAGFLVLGFVTVTSMEGNRVFDKNLIQPIEALFASSIEEEDYLSEMYVYAGESYSFSQLTSKETINIKSKSTGEVYSNVDASSWMPDKSEEVTIWATKIEKESGLIFAPIAILLRVLLVLIFSLTWIPFWNIIDFTLRMIGKSESERSDFWKDAYRIDAILLCILLSGLAILDVQRASGALDTVIGLWRTILMIPVVVIVVLILVDVLVALVNNLKNFNFQGVQDNKIASQIIVFLTSKKAQYVTLACLLVFLFLPWWTATGSASGGGFSASSSASVSGIEIYPGWLSLMAIIATTIGIKNNTEWKKWTALGSILACMLIMTIGSASTSSSYGGASASASMGPDIGFFLFLLFSLILFIPMMVSSYFVRDTSVN